MWPFVWKSAYKKLEKKYFDEAFKVGTLRLRIFELETELKIAQKNDHRDPKTKRFIKAPKKKG